MRGVVGIQFNTMTKKERIYYGHFKFCHGFKENGQSEQIRYVEFGQNKDSRNTVAHISDSFYFDVYEKQSPQTKEKLVISHGIDVRTFCGVVMRPITIKKGLLSSKRGFNQLSIICCETTYSLRNGYTNDVSNIRAITDLDEAIRKNMSQSEAWTVQVVLIPGAAEQYKENTVQLTLTRFNLALTVQLGEDSKFSDTLLHSWSLSSPLNITCHENLHIESTDGDLPLLYILKHKDMNCIMKKILEAQGHLVGPENQCHSDSKPEDQLTRTTEVPIEKETYVGKLYEMTELVVALPPSLPPRELPPDLPPRRRHYPLPMEPELPELPPKQKSPNINRGPKPIPRINYINHAIEPKSSPRKLQLEIPPRKVKETSKSPPTPAPRTTKSPANVNSPTLPRANTPPNIGSYTLPRVTKSNVMDITDVMMSVTESPNRNIPCEHSDVIGVPEVHKRIKKTIKNNFIRHSLIPVENSDIGSSRSRSTEDVHISIYEDIDSITEVKHYEKIGSCEDLFNCAASVDSRDALLLKEENYSVIPYRPTYRAVQQHYDWIRNASKKIKNTSRVQLIVDKEDRDDDGAASGSNRDSDLYWSKDIAVTLQEIIEKRPLRTGQDTLQLDSLSRTKLAWRLYSLKEMSKDWREFANILCIPFQDVCIIEEFTRSHSTATAAEVVLRHWQRLHNKKKYGLYSCILDCSKVNLAKILKEMEREDILEDCDLRRYLLGD